MGRGRDRIKFHTSTTQRVQQRPPQVSVAWMITANTFPGTPKMRERMRIAAPWTQNKLPMRSAAVFLWLFGGAVLLGLVN